MIMSSAPPLPAGERTQNTYSYPLPLRFTQFRVGVAQVRQVCRARPGVQLRQQPVIERCRFEVRHPAGWIVDITKNNRPRWTGGLTGGDYLTITDGAVFELGLNAGSADTLHTVRAFFHNAAGTHRDLGIVQQLQARRVIVGILQKVKASYLIRTVVGAVARANTAVVDHVVEPFLIMHGSVRWADDLARGVFTVHTQDGLVIHFRVGWHPLVIAIKA